MKIVVAAAIGCSLMLLLPGVAYASSAQWDFNSIGRLECSQELEVGSSREILSQQPNVSAVRLCQLDQALFADNKRVIR